jgi:hypothetical protein
MDWLKIETSTPQKPEVLLLAEALAIAPAHAFGLCFAFWAWCDAHLTADAPVVRSLSGSEPDISRTLVRINSAVNFPGFAEALCRVGWLVPDPAGWRVPNFSRHLGSSAKARARDSKRKHEKRQAVPKMSGSEPDKNRTPVREMSGSDPDKLGTREDKIRENLSPACVHAHTREGMPTLDEVWTYVQQLAVIPPWTQEAVNRWADDRESRGWETAGGVPITPANWRADVRLAHSWAVQMPSSRGPQNPEPPPQKKEAPLPDDHDALMALVRSEYPACIAAWPDLPRDIRDWAISALKKNSAAA